MGAADIVPGVSGGTMAFILGIYEELVLSLRNMGRPIFWQPFLRGRFLNAFRAVHGSFLVAVGTGIVCAVLLLSHGLAFLLDTYPVVIWSFFFGLVLSSVAVVAKRVPTWKGTYFLFVILGAGVAYFFVGLVPVHTPVAPWFLVASGAIAICATILPGISGAFVLVLLGKYAFILHAINERDVASVAYVLFGALMGVVLFTQFLHWLLKKYHNATVAFLIGFMLGSLRKIWPWKVAGANVLPHIVSHSLPNEGFLVGLLCMIVGLLLVILIDRTAKR